MIERRKDFPPNDDVWTFRRDWPQLRSSIKADLLSGEYRFSPLNCFPKRKEEVRFVWTAQDSLVQKLCANRLSQYLNGVIAETCTHVKGHGGLKQTVNQVQDAVSSHAFFYRSDIKSYYQSIDHKILFKALTQVIPNKPFLGILWRFLKHTLHHGGWFADNEKGLPLGSPLSPLLSALYLKPLDDAMEKRGIVYYRFQDDDVMLSTRRWPLNRAIKQHHRILEQLGLTIRPEKTQVGRVEKGFNFLSYVLKPKALKVSTQTIARACNKVRRLRQQKSKPKTETVEGSVSKRSKPYYRSSVKKSLTPEPEQSLI